MKRWEVVVHLRDDSRHAHPDGVRVWFDPSLSVEEHREGVRESLKAVQRVMVEGGVLYLPTSDCSAYWVNTRDVAGVEISGPKGEVLEW